MAYMISYETLDACLLLIGLLFGGCIACEWLKDDMKYLYQGVMLLTISAVSLIMGFELFTGNIWYGGLGGMQFEPLGWILLFVGGVSFLLLLVIWGPKIAAPFNVHVSPFPRPAIKPMQPPQPRLPKRPGGF